MPLNTACSFAGKSVHEPTINQFVVIWMTAFKKGENHNIANETSFEIVAHTATAFMRKKIAEGVKDSSINIAD